MPGSTFGADPAWDPQSRIGDPNSGVRLRVGGVSGRFRLEIVREGRGSSDRCLGGTVGLMSEEVAMGLRRMAAGGFVVVIGCGAAVVAQVGPTHAERSATPLDGRAYDTPWTTDDLLCGREDVLAPLRARIAAGELQRRRLTTRAGGTMDIGNIAVIEDDGTMVDGSNTTDSVNIVNAFYATHPDDYDEIVIWVASTFAGDVDPEAGFAFYSGVSSHASGINAGIGESSEGGGLNRLKGFCNMNDLPEYPADPNGQFFGGVASGIEILGQEFLHAYGAFVNVNGADILGRSNAHWSFFVHLPGGPGSASPMEGNLWQDNGGGSFTTVESFTNFCHLDDYVMGLRAPADVDPFYVIDFVTDPFSDSTFPAPGVNVTGGTRIDLTINDIIAANGARLPDTDTSQKVFKIAFILLIPQGTMASQADLDKLEAYRAEWETYFETGVDNLGEMNAVLGYPAGGPPFVGTIDFESGTFDDAIWEYNQGATIDDVALNEINGTLSMRLNGGYGAGDEIRSRMFDLSGFAGQEVRLQYAVERTGGGNSPETNEDLEVDYWSAAGAWVNLRTFLGSGPDESNFTAFSDILPADALHDQFRFRFHRLQGSGSATDDYFVDNIAIVPPPSGCIGDLDNDGDTDVLDFGVFAANFGSAVPPGTLGDFDNDGFVTVLDFGAFTADFGCQP